MPALFILLGLTYTLALQIIVNDQPNLYVPSPIFNRDLGLQVFDQITANAVVTVLDNVCDLPQPDLVALAQGNIVVFVRHRDDFWEFEAERRNLHCLNAVGAAGVVLAYQKYFEPGLGSRVCVLDHYAGHIPLLHVVTRDLPQYLLDGNVIVNMTLTADPNLYDKLWDSRYFSILWLVVLPLLNGGGVVVGFTALFILFGHVAASSKHRKERCSHSFLLISGFSIMTMTCFIRLFYCLAGPFYASRRPGLTMDYHLIMLNFTSLFEAIASMMAIALFRTWAKFTMTKRVLRVHRALAVLAVASMPVCLTVVVLHLTHSADVMYLAKVVKPALVVTLASVVSLVSLQRVIGFLLPAARGKLEKTRNHNAKLVRVSVLMVVSGLMNFVVVVVLSVILGKSGRLMYSLNGHFLTYTIIFFALTAQGITHMFALFPSTRTLRETKLWKRVSQHSFLSRSPVFEKKTQTPNRRDTISGGGTLRDISSQFHGPFGAVLSLATSEHEDDSAPNSSDEVDQPRPPCPADDVEIAR